jgi:hypothetical protein
MSGPPLSLRIMASAILLVSLLLSSGQSFQLSMMVASKPTTPAFTSKSSVQDDDNGDSQRIRQRINFATLKTGGQNIMDPASMAVSQLTELAIKLRLTEYRDVTCEVYSKPTDVLLRGRVGPVNVKGRLWKSRRGLSCQAIEATLETCELDINRALSRQELILSRPAQGRAMIALTSEDLGHFVTHPRMQPPIYKTSSSSLPIQFLKLGTTIDPKSESVSFRAIHGESEFKVTLQRGPSQHVPAIAHVSSVSNKGDDDIADKISANMSTVLTAFFNEMTFELDGTFLSFSDMMVVEKGGSPTVMLAVAIRVVRLPAPGNRKK